MQLWIQSDFRIPISKPVVANVDKAFLPRPAQKGNVISLVSIDMQSKLYLKSDGL